MKDNNQLPEPELGYIQTDKSNQPAFSARQMREAMKHAMQARAQVQGVPVGFTYQAEIAYADSTGGNGSFWRVPPDLDDEAVPLYTHPAPGVPDDVQRDAERYRWLRSLEHCNEAWCFIGSGNANSNLDAAIDAAMLAAKDTK